MTYILGRAAQYFISRILSEEGYIEENYEGIHLKNSSNKTVCMLSNYQFDLIRVRFNLNKQRFEDCVIYTLDAS